MKNKNESFSPATIHLQGSLDAKFAQTGLSRAQANRIIARIDEKLELLPQVIEQAHERIIGGRTVKNHTGSRVWRAKGLAHRKRAVGWSVLAHNLQWLARRVREQEDKEAQPMAKSA